MTICVLDGLAANPGDLSWEPLVGLGQCTVYDRTAPDQVLERAAGAEAILTNKTVITAAHMQALPDLKYIGVLATGYNVVDIDAARQRGIVVTNIPAYSTASVAQMVFAHLLNITQHVAHYADDNRHGRWSASKDFCYWDTPLVELAGKRIGIAAVIAGAAQEQYLFPLAAAAQFLFQGIHHCHGSLLHKQQAGHPKGKGLLFRFPHIPGCQHLISIPIRSIIMHIYTFLSAMAMAAATPPSWEMDRCRLVICRWAACWA